ncbi:unnamed protein product [Caenorhabditis nigoni]
MFRWSNDVQEDRTRIPSLLKERPKFRKQLDSEGKLKKEPWILRKMTCLCRHLRRPQNWNRTLTKRMSLKERTMKKRRRPFRRRSRNRKNKEIFCTQRSGKHIIQQKSSGKN